MKLSVTWYVFNVKEVPSFFPDMLTRYILYVSVLCVHCT